MSIPPIDVSYTPPPPSPPSLSIPAPELILAQRVPAALLDGPLPETSPLMQIDDADHGLTLDDCLAWESFEGNGCGSDEVFPALRPLIPQGFLGAEFDDACNGHDTCYAEWGQTQEQCDNQFEVDLKDSCDESWLPWLCRRVGGMMAGAVRWFGQGSYEVGQREATHCPAILDQHRATFKTSTNDQ